MKPTKPTDATALPRIRGPDGGEIGRGLIAYDAADAVRLAGRKSGEIESVLGAPGRVEMIHRDDMVVGSE